MEARKPDRRYTLEDYLSWPEGTRVELIDGVIYDMAPEPSPNHQLLHSYLFGELCIFLKGKPCTPLSAPTDVILSDEKDATTVVQPDIFVFCDEEQFTPKGIVGAPKFVIEILSPSSAINDLITKRALYEKNGVEEYWVISPPTRTIARFSLNDGKYADTLFDKDAVLESTSLPGFRVDLGELFVNLRDA